MERFMMRQIVPSFEQWHPVFAGHGETRKSAGCTAESIFQNPGNPNEVVILTEWESKEQLQAFMVSQRSVIAKASGGSAPQGFFLVPAEG